MKQMGFEARREAMKTRAISILAILFLLAALVSVSVLP